MMPSLLKHSSYSLYSPSSVYPSQLKSVFHVPEDLHASIVTLAYAGASLRRSSDLPILSLSAYDIVRL
jgi:hypothetical protein